MAPGPSPTEPIEPVTGDIEGLHKTKKSYQWDPNLPQEKVDAIIEEPKADDQENAIEQDKSLAQDSPYEAVRAAVRSTDDGEVANTVRAWLLGTIFVTIGSGLNMFLSMRHGIWHFR